MNFLKKWFHVHKMEKVASEECNLVYVESIRGFRIKEEKQTGLLIVSKCAACDYEEAYLSNGILTQPYDLLTAKHKLGI